MRPLDTAFQLFDDYNKQDPRDVTWDGISYPYEYFYALQLYHWVVKLNPDASEPLLLASRCQHIGRWQSPRDSYPEGKAGYLRWRSDLKQFHAETAGRLLEKAGYKEETIKSVQHIVLKQALKTDADVQVMEDALCLVFLEFQYDDFLKSHDDAKVIRILQKSWSKMNERGRQAAATLVFQPKGKELLDRALANSQ